MTVTGRTGLVIARHRRETVIQDDSGQTFGALVRGRRLRPLTGDHVRFELEPDGTAVIHEILPRSSVLERIDGRGRAEGVAANLSFIAIVIAPKPITDWQLVDRYLVAAALMDIEAGIVCNKSDIADATLDARALTYRRIGYAVVATSTKTGQGLDSLTEMLQNHRSVLVGQSGVGKSSLINALLNTDLQATADLSTRRSLGRHTTTASALYRIPGGGELIDSPGVRRYSPSVANQADLAHGFVEFRSLVADCRFSDCRHLDEPDCAIVSAVERGDVARDRYESYRAMTETLERLNAM